MKTIPGSSRSCSPHHSGGILQLLKAYFGANRIGDLLVLKGRLEPDQLNHALVLAKSQKKRIGQVLVEQRMIRRHELYATLGTQWGIRSLTWSVTMVMSFGALSPRSVRADESATNYAITQTFSFVSPMRVAMTRDDVRPIRSYPALFGSDERRSNDLSAFTKWTSMFARYQAELESGAARPALVSWKRQVAPHGGQSLVNLAKGIDVALNKIPYVEDRVNWGRSDYWETPIEFFTRGGDCEDYAIAKYMSLKAMGVPENRLRIAIVHDLVKNIPHAVLIVYTDEGQLVLDNQSSVTRWAHEITRYKPIFSINATSWWLHTKSANVQVATAAQ